MIEKMFPQTVSNILDYRAIRDAARVYVEDVMVKAEEAFAHNLMLRTMDEEELSTVSSNVMGSPSATLEELLNYMNTDNVYRECDFVSELHERFPNVVYKLYDVTGWQFPETPSWAENERGGEDWDWVEASPLARFNFARFSSDKLQVPWPDEKRPGRRGSWGNSSTWMTTGGFGSPGTIELDIIGADLDSNGLLAVENWLGSIGHKLPINLNIEITNYANVQNTAAPDWFRLSYTYGEQEVWVSNADNPHKL